MTARPPASHRGGFCLIALPEVMRMTERTASDIAKLIEVGAFPLPYTAPPRAKRWRSDEIEAWVAEREAEPERALLPPPPRPPKGYGVNEAALVRVAPEHSGRFMGPDRLRSFAVPVADLFSLAAGIYFLWRADRVVYVGQTITGFSRIASHMAGGRDFDAVSFIRCPREQLSVVEREYLDRLLPEYNMDPVTQKARRSRKVWK